MPATGPTVDTAAPSRSRRPVPAAVVTGPVTEPAGRSPTRHPRRPAPARQSGLRSTPSPAPGGAGGSRRATRGGGRRRCPHAPGIAFDAFGRSRRRDGPPRLFHGFCRRPPRPPWSPPHPPAPGSGSAPDPPAHGETTVEAADVVAVVDAAARLRGRPPRPGASRRPPFRRRRRDRPAERLGARVSRLTLAPAGRARDLTPSSPVWPPPALPARSRTRCARLARGVAPTPRSRRWRRRPRGLPAALLPTCRADRPARRHPAPPPSRGASRSGRFRHRGSRHPGHPRFRPAAAGRGALPADRPHAAMGRPRVRRPS